MLNFVFAVWMIWDVYAALDPTRPADKGACVPSNTDCVLNLSDTLPGAVAAAVAALLFAIAILLLICRHWRDLTYRA